MFHSVVPKKMDDMLSSVKFENSTNRRIVYITSSREHLTGMTGALLNNRTLLALLATNMKKEAEKAVGIDLKSEDLRGKFLETAYSIEVASKPSNNDFLWGFSANWQTCMFPERDR